MSISALLSSQIRCFEFSFLVHAGALFEASVELFKPHKSLNMIVQHDAISALESRSINDMLQPTNGFWHYECAFLIAAMVSTTYSFALSSSPSQ